MARIAGVSLPREKQVKIALTYIYGVGRTKAIEICNNLKIDPEARLKDLTEAEVNLLRDEIEKKQQVEGNLRQKVGLNIKRLKEINTYRGVRHKAGLPVRGQRTKTNARTKRGRRMTMGSGKVKALKK